MCLNHGLAASVIRALFRFKNWHSRYNIYIIYRCISCLFKKICTIYLNIGMFLNELLPLLLNLPTRSAATFIFLWLAVIPRLWWSMRWSSFSGVGSLGSSHWELMGDAMVTTEQVRLTPDMQSRQGAVWSRIVSIYLSFTDKITCCTNKNCTTLL